MPLAVVPAGSVKYGEIMSFTTVSLPSVVSAPPVSIWLEICWKMLFSVPASAAER